MAIVLAQAEALRASPKILHGFFGRTGGVSEPPFESLNASVAVGDAPDRVAQNLARICAVFGLKPDELAMLRQVHSARVVPLARVAHPGEDPVEGDAMVTRSRRLALGILMADCAPVLLADSEAGVIGAAHAGWKGAVEGVVEATIRAMVQAGAEAHRIVAAIGPTISAANYEVGPDFAASLIARHPAAAARLFKPTAGAREHFDLPGFVADQLAAAGVSQIERIDQCTYGEPERYFSHRYATHRGAQTGRQLSLIAIR